MTMGCVFDLAGKTYTRGCASFERAENYILFYISPRPESYTCLYIKKSAEISEHAKSWESTFDKVRVAYVREISCGVFLAASLREDGNVLHDLVQCDFANSPDEEKKTKNLRRKVIMYSARKNISFVCIFSRTNEKGQEQRVLLSAWYRDSRFLVVRFCTHFQNQ